MLSFYIVVFGAGGLCLAAIYHTILFIHKRDKLLLYYCMYLWCVFFYLCYRLFYGITAEYHTRELSLLKIRFAEDMSFLMFVYAVYVGFWSRALSLTKKDGIFIWYYYKSLLPVIFTYIIWENIALNVDTGAIQPAVYIGVRLYLSIFTFAALVNTLKLRRNTYYYYIASGTLTLIFAGLFSTYVQLVSKGTLLNVNPFGWMAVGYFVEIIFFSASIGYKLKLETIEKINALNKVLEQQQIIQIKEIEKVQAAYQAREGERMRISAELHDDLGGGLSTISLLSEMMKGSSGDDKVSKQLNIISDSSKDLVQKLNEIVWALNINNDNLQSLIAYLRQYIVKALENIAIGCTVIAPENIPGISIPSNERRNIFLMVKECIHNIIKHSKASHVILKVELNESLCITIHDNGIGLKHAVTDVNHFGLNNLKKRAQQLNGNIEWHENGGTIVHIQIPIITASHKSGIS
jgi:signal transduction histidine kinase